MGMTQVCERYNLKLLTYGSLVRIAQLLSILNSTQRFHG